MKKELSCLSFLFVFFQFIEKFSDVREATRTSTKPNGTTPTTSASASPVATRYQFLGKIF